MQFRFLLYRFTLLAAGCVYYASLTNGQIRLTFPCSPNPSPRPGGNPRPGGLVAHFLRGADCARGGATAAKGGRPFEPFFFWIFQFVQ